MQMPQEISSAIAGIQGLMVSVATRSAMPEVSEEIRYQDLYRLIRDFYQKEEIEHKNGFASLKEWRGYAMATWQTYSERKQHVKSLYQSSDLPLADYQARSAIKKDDNLEQIKKPFHQNWLFRGVAIGIILLFIQYTFCEKKTPPKQSAQLTASPNSSVTQVAGNQYNLGASKQDIEEVGNKFFRKWEEILDLNKDQILHEIKNANLQKGNLIAEPDLKNEEFMISKLAEQCMWYRPDGGDYESYLQLWNYLKDERLKEFVLNRLVQVNSKLELSYRTVSREIPVCKAHKNIDNLCLEVETPNDFDIRNVLSQLSHPEFWVSRVKSAYLLRFLTVQKVQEYNSTHPENKVSWQFILDALHKVFWSSEDKKQYNNLLTRYMAWDAFRIHTCSFKEKDLFDPVEANKWWANEENKKKILEALGSGQKSPFCN